MINISVHGKSVVSEAWVGDKSVEIKAMSDVQLTALDALAIQEIHGLHPDLVGMYDFKSVKLIERWVSTWRCARLPK